MRLLADLEAAAYDTWTPDRTTKVGDWRLYATDGFTRRVNCATSVGTPAIDDTTKAALEAWLSKNGAAMVIRVTPLLSAETQTRICEEWGFDAIDDTVVMTAPARGQYAESVRLVDVADRGFFADINHLNDRRDSSVPAWQRLLARVRARAAGMWIPGVGAGLVVHSGHFAAVYSLAVHVDHRRQGVAARMMDTATAWAADRGAQTMFLQVHGENAAALGLYGALGYAEQYRYSYLQAPSESVAKTIDGC
jgi:ribosomal protein S18 acetylase RimI-like enzyme